MTSQLEHGRRTALLRSGERLAQVMLQMKDAELDAVAQHAAEALGLLLFEIMQSKGLRYPDSDLAAREAMRRIVDGQEFNEVIVSTFAAWAAVAK